MSEFSKEQRELFENMNLSEELSARLSKVLDEKDLMNVSGGSSGTGREIVDAYNVPCKHCEMLNRFLEGGNLAVRRCIDLNEKRDIDICKHVSIEGGLNGTYYCNRNA